MKNLVKVLALGALLAGGYKASAQTELTYYTSMGTFKVTLTDTKTPRTVDSFKARVLHKFYDGLIFHRVIAGFVIQGGDPLGTGYGGPGYYTPDEFDTSLKNVTGSIAMANSGANTNGSQFYFNLVNNASLNGGYTVFGMVTSGLSVVQNIGLVAVNSASKPLTDVVIDSIRITKYPAAVANIANELNVAVYPNPCRGSFNVELPEVATRVEVLSVSGQVVYTASAKGVLKIDLKNQPAGLYMVRGSNANGSFERKVVVQ